MSFLPVTLDEAVLWLERNGIADVTVRDLLRLGAYGYLIISTPLLCRGYSPIKASDLSFEEMGSDDAYVDLYGVYVLPPRTLFELDAKGKARTEVVFSHNTKEMFFVHSDVTVDDLRITFKDIERFRNSIKPLILKTDIEKISAANSQDDIKTDDKPVSTPPSNDSNESHVFTFIESHTPSNYSRVTSVYYFGKMSVATTKDEKIHAEFLAKSSSHSQIVTLSEWDSEILETLGHVTAEHVNFYYRSNDDRDETYKRYWHVIERTKFTKADIVYHSDDIKTDDEPILKQYEKYKTSFDNWRYSINFNIKAVKLKVTFEQVKLFDSETWNIEFSTFRREFWQRYSKENDINLKGGRPKNA
jgi:hypothetical protein